MAEMKGPDGLEQFADDCLKALIIETPTEFNYPDDCSLNHWPVNEIRTLNKIILDSLRNSGNVYALYTKSKMKNSSWVPVYVGQRKSASLRERITQHLVTKNERTGSTLEAVKTAVADGNKIAISYIKVNPESLRLYVEETIIGKKKKTLPWNTHG
jgi:hypothetical protein